MTAPERIRRGGWIVTGECGRPHLTGRYWRLRSWECPVCGEPA